MGRRKLEPYALVLYQNRLYVVGRDVQKDADRTFAIDLMKRVRALPAAPFKRNPEFNVQRLFEGAFGIYGGGAERQHVVVDFDARVAQYIEPREWHPTQKTSRLPGGDLRIEFDATGLTEVVGWVLRFGRAPALATLANLVAAPLAELVALPLSLVTAVVAMLSPTLAGPFAWVTGHSLSALFSLAAWAQRVPFASTAWTTPTAGQAAVATAALVAFAMLRWGSAAVVREPDELKKRVRDELARGLERYGGGDAAG